MLKYHLLKIVQSFIFPPGIIVFFLFLTALFSKRFKKFFLFLTFVSYLLTTQFMGNLLISPLETPYKKSLIKQKDVSLVVVLGGGYYEGSPNLPLSLSAFKRAIFGYEVAKKTALPLLYNGSGKESESAKLTYKELFSDNKIKIFYENRALNTLDNATLTKEFLEKKGLKKRVYLVTSAFHMKRALKAFKSVGIDAIPTATDFRTSKSFCWCFFFPSSEGLNLNYLALHEYVGIILAK
jgi:uncharacterized SAM-binding protein YcdF (DUF218 family)